MSEIRSVAVVGAGLAGAEASIVLARSGINVSLYEMRPERMTPAHATGLPAELVCSNSLKSQELPTAHGLLKKELEFLGSPLIAAAHATAVPAGSALAVNRHDFSVYVRDIIDREPRIAYHSAEVTEPPAACDACIIAAGPLVSEKLAAWIAQEFSARALNFYDAIAPIVAHDSIDRSIVFQASRNQEGEGDYLNCPFSEEEYRGFYDALIEADKVQAHLFENETFFEGCLPIEVLANRGFESLAFGPLKPIGLTDPRTGRWPYAVCQLRKEDLAGESYNLVGFQTRLTIPEQKRVFRLIPGLENVEILRFGSIHRNTYLDSPSLLLPDLSFKKHPHLFLAGQLSGNEGYTESIATGHMAALFVAAKLLNKPLNPPPRESALGSLLHHITTPGKNRFTPTNIHFGLFPPLDEQKKRCKRPVKKAALCARALEGIKVWSSAVL